MVDLTSKVWGAFGLQGFVLLATFFSEVGLWPGLDFPGLFSLCISVHRILSLEVLQEGGLVPFSQPSVREDRAQHTRKEPL